MKKVNREFVFYTDKEKGSKVITCISHFAGKIVKGYAKCSPNDVYNEETGKKLAALRCDKKVALKRVNKAYDKLEVANEWLAAAEEYKLRMENYVEDALGDLSEVTYELNELEDSIN